MKNFIRITSLAVAVLAATAVHSEKKIELHDIEEDNLKSEKEQDTDNTLGFNKQSHSTEPQKDLLPLDLFKHSLAKPYIQRPASMPQQTRYIHQYAVDEPSEQPSMINSNAPIMAGAQQAMIGYLSNLPMHIYLIPRGYGEQTESTVNFPTSAAGEATWTEPDVTPITANYVEIPTYFVPSGKGYMHQYTPQVTYVTHDHKPVAVTPIPYGTFSSGPASSSETYPSSSEPIIPTQQFRYPMVYKDGDQTQHEEHKNIEDPSEHKGKASHRYLEQSETDKNPFYSQLAQYNKHPGRVPQRNGHHPSSIAELPTPNPHLLKGSGSLEPKALPFFRPTAKPVYGQMRYFANDKTEKPSGAFAYLRKHHNSLLDSYVPSSVQLDYMKKGFTKDPLSAYEALSSAMRLRSHLSGQRAFERGFLPNQMYPTAAGGVTYGHTKRNPMQENLGHK